MKKLLPPALNRWFCYTLVLLCSAMYAQPCTFEDVVKETTHNNSNNNYKKISSYYNKTDTLTHFREIGDKSIMKKFPKKWSISVYQATSHNDSVSEKKFYKITNYYKRNKN